MKRKTFITKCGYSWGDFAPTHTINPWLGCTFNCDYCWARDWWWRRMQGPLSKVWGVPDGFKWRAPVLFDGWEKAIEDELTGHGWDRGPIRGDLMRVLLCSMTDPYIVQEEQMGVTRRILELLGQANIPTMILTKAALLPERDFDILKSMDAWFGMTMDRDWSHSNWHYARVTTLWSANRCGVKTFVSLEPWIPGVDAKAIVEDLAEVVDHWIVGRLNYKGVGDEFYQENLPGLIEVLETESGSFYIKPDLMRCLEEKK